MNNEAKKALESANAGLNGQHVTRRGDTVFVPLPKALWRSCGKCSCEHCKGEEGFWDTLAIAAAEPGEGSDTSWTVHGPEFRFECDCARCMSARAKPAPKQAPRLRVVR